VTVFQARGAAGGNLHDGSGQTADGVGHAAILNARVAACRRRIRAAAPPEFEEV
jgi:hypothetical protein